MIGYLKPYYSRNEVAESLGCNPRKVTWLIQNGFLETSGLTKDYRIPAESILRFNAEYGNHYDMTTKEKIETVARIKNRRGKTSKV